MPSFGSYVLPVLMLCAFNVFMTLAWDRRLKFKATPPIVMTFVSWGIALIVAGAALVFRG